MEGATIGDPFVLNPLVCEILELFDSFREKKKRYGVSSCALITGESGSGKSGIAKQYVKRNPRVEVPEGVRLPVLHYELTTISNPSDFLRALLIAIDDPQRGEGARNSGELFRRLLVLLRALNVELIILDEIQVIIERRKRQVISGIADLFKDLVKSSKIPIVFMGMPWSGYLTDSNEQLNSRISFRRIIPSYRISDRKNRDDYRRLLKSLADYYGISQLMRLDEHEMALRIFSFSAGNLRDTVNLIRDVYMLSEMDNSSVSADVFAEVVRRYGVNDEGNPFLIPLKKIELRELVCHSDYLFHNRSNKSSIIHAQYATYGVTEDRKIYSLLGSN